MKIENDNFFEFKEISFGVGGFKDANVTGNIFIKKMIEVVQTGRWEEHNIDLVLLSKAIKETTDKREQAILKAKLPWVTMSGLCNRICSDQNMIEHSGFLQGDIDKGDNPNWFEHPLKAFELDRDLKDDPYILFYWFSPSGGRKALVRIPPSFETHRASFKALEKYFKEKYNVIIDGACKNPSRKLCLSHSPAFHINYDCKIFEDMINPIMQTPTIEDTTKHNCEKTDTDYNKILSCVEQLEDNQIDITDKYSDWLNLAFSLGNLGEDGRSLFHRISKINAKYKFEECDKLYSRTIKNKSQVSLASFFFHCKKVSVSPLNRGRIIDEINNTNYFEDWPIEEDALDEKTNAIKTVPAQAHETPIIPTSIYDNLPESIQALTTCFQSGRQRDMFFVSLLGALSNCLPNVFGLYNNKWIPTNLYFMVSAPFASGKSVATWAIKVTDSIHELFKERYQAELDDFNQASKEEGGGKPQKKPVMKLFVIPGNVSAAGLIELLSSTGRGFIAETETDTILSAWGNKEWGSYSDIWRAASENEPIKFYRKVQKEFLEVSKVYLSILITGTPKSTQKLFISPENGLFSRFLFYTFTENIPFKDPFGKGTSFDKVFTDYGQQLLNIYCYLESLEMVRVSLTADQKLRFNQHFQDIVDNAPTYYGLYTGQILKRIAAMHFKLCMILTMLRRFDDGDIEEDVYCNEVDFTVATELITVLKEHCFTVLQTLPDKEKDENATSRHKLFACLPEEFTTAEAVKSAYDSQKASARTLKRMLVDWQAQGKIERVKHGVYKKT